MGISRQYLVLSHLYCANYLQNQVSYLKGSIFSYKFVFWQNFTSLILIGKLAFMIEIVIYIFRLKVHFLRSKIQYRNINFYRKTRSCLKCKTNIQQNLFPPSKLSEQNFFSELSLVLILEIQNKKKNHHYVFTFFSYDEEKQAKESSIIL